MRKDWLAANRANWDDRTPIHLQSRFYDVDGWLAQGRPPRAREAEALGDVAGLTLVHLQCHIGLDTLTWARAGADVTGIDFSSPAIDAARSIAARAGLAERSRFLCADVYDASEALAGETFDIAYVSLGALCWLPSVDRWAAQVANVVRPGGRFFIHDGHPTASAMADDEPVFERPYFEEQAPVVFDDDVTYTDGDQRLLHTRTYEWNHSLGQIVTSLIAHGLRLEWLTEHDWTAWPRFPFLVEAAPGRWSTPPNRPRLPLSFSLLATKPDTETTRAGSGDPA